MRTEAGDPAHSAATIAHFLLPGPRSEKVLRLGAPLAAALPGPDRMRRASATVGPLEELTATAGYRVESSGRLPVLRYVLAIRPDDE
jgi:hypothetical protein